jgi:hypothetical protein
MATKRPYSAFQRACIVAFCSSPLVSKEAVADGTLAPAVFGGIALAEIGSVRPDLIPYPLSGGKSSGGRSLGVAGGESLAETASPEEAETSLCKNVEDDGSRLLCSEKDDCLGAAAVVLP